MRPIGFSTGALAKGDVARGLDLVRAAGLPVVELSVLREAEFDNFVGKAETLDLTGFKYVSIHAPGTIQVAREHYIVARLIEFAAHGWPVVVHPEAIQDVEAWRDLGASLCLENMDQRKPTGRNRAELAWWFDRLPEAGFCLDLGHARQWDPSMIEAYWLIKRFRARLRQIHLSEVTSSSRHERLNRLAIRAFQDVAAYVPNEVPIVLESPVSSEDLMAEVTAAAEALPSQPWAG